MIAVGFLFWVLLQTSITKGNEIPDFSSSIIIETHSPIVKGALIDDYENNALIIKLTPPSKMLSDALATIDIGKTPKSSLTQLQLQIGYLEKIYQSQYQIILESYQQMITTPKSGKLTRYGKFIKTLKLGGYVATTPVFAYEMADIFGTFPDRKYEELTNQIKILYENRAEDLKVIDRVALVTMSLNEQIRDVTSEFKQLISEADNISDLRIRGSHLLSNYLNQLTFSLMILLEGKIPTFLMSLETQENWLEKKINSGLLLYLSTISPHLKVDLKAIDEIQGQLIIQVSVPVPDTRFQLLHFVQWKPKLWVEGKCYSSPASYFYLAYPSSKSAETIIKKPMLIDPRSCLTNGFLMCESASILKKIPDLTVNEICSTLPMINRKKRSAFTSVEVINGPYVNLSSLVDISIQKITENEKTKTEIKSIRDKLSNLLIENEKQKIDPLKKLKSAEKERRIYKGIFIGSVILLFIIGIALFWLFRAIQFCCTSSLECPIITSKP